MSKEIIVPAYVRAFASAHNIDLAGIEATATPGVLTLVDVCNALTAKSQYELASEALQGQFDQNAKSYDGAQRPHSGPRRPGTVSPDLVASFPVKDMAANPLADRVRTAAASARAQVPRGPKPTLFASGDLPSFTASGIPPSSLLEVPFQARHAMAAATTPAEAMAIASECEQGNAEFMFGNHPGNADYARRIDQWIYGSMTNAELQNHATAAGARDELTRREGEQYFGELPDGDVDVINGLIRQAGIRL